MTLDLLYPDGGRVTILHAKTLADAQHRVGDLDDRMVGVSIAEGSEILCTGQKYGLRVLWALTEKGKGAIEQTTGPPEQRRRF